MLSIYRLLISLIFLLSPIIFIYRRLKKKENFKSYKEKIGLFSKKRKKGNLLWFHGASVGEIQSIIPLLEKFEKENKVQQILLTSNTLSSLNVINKIKLQKITHQFFPIDINFINNIFLNYWKPSKVYFIDSEIWPNMILNLRKRNVPINLINGRITKKSFKRWMFFPNLSKKIFSNIDLCLASSVGSKKILKRLFVKNVKFYGNLKFSQSEKEKYKINNNLKKFLSNKKVWCAASTHESEEKICADVHIKLKKKYKDITTIIIPRHVERCEEIKNDLENLSLKVHMDSPQKKIKKNTDIYLVNTYGKTKKFFKYSKNVFLGGSLINHGGQNPLEAARFGCNILHGPNTENFTEIYMFLNKKKITQKITNKFDFWKKLNKLMMANQSLNNESNKLNILGKKILNKTFKAINI